MRTIYRERKQMVTAHASCRDRRGCVTGKVTKHKVNRLSQMAREIETTRKPRRGEALMALEDEKKGRQPSSDNGSVNREEPGAAKRQKKSVVRGTTENWGRENTWTAGEEQQSH